MDGRFVATAGCALPPCQILFYCPVYLSARKAMPVTVLSSPLDVRLHDRERVLGKIRTIVVDWLDQLAGGDLPVFEAV